MPDGGTLTIRTRNVSERESLKLTEIGVAAGEYLLVEVEDTGVGIAPDVVGKIFEPFFTTKEVGKGTGLGLSTVYGIVKQTGGYIFADSEVGKGTTFRVYLPRHIVENEDELPQRAKKSEPTRDLTGSGRVLLVEDEDVVRNFAVRALSRQGYEVLEAASGVEAVEVMERESHRVDIVVSDVIMPEMDGPTLLKELRKTNPNLKFIFVSGYPDDAFKKSLDDGRGLCLSAQALHLAPARRQGERAARPLTSPPAFPDAAPRPQAAGEAIRDLSRSNSHSKTLLHTTRRFFPAGPGGSREVRRVRGRLAATRGPVDLRPQQTRPGLLEGSPGSPPGPGEGSPGCLAAPA